MLVIIVIGLLADKILFSPWDVPVPPLGNGEVVAARRSLHHGSIATFLKPF